MHLDSSAGVAAKIQDYLLYNSLLALGSGVDGMRPLLKQIAWLCLLLMISAAIGVVAHHHSDASESAPCTICIAAHSAAPTVPVLSPRVTFRAVSTLRAEPVAGSRQRLIAFALSVRPPPES